MGGSIIATVLIWQSWWGILTTLILASTIIIHESGHIWQIKRYGMKAEGLYLTPIGGIALTDSTIKSYWQEAVIALMGPVFGIAYGLIQVVLFLITGEPIFLLAAKIIGFIHLFNFLPISPLDGGRVVKAVLIALHPIIALGAIWLGIWICVIGLFKTAHVVFIFIAFFAFKEAQSLATIQYYRAHPATLEMLPKNNQGTIRQLIDINDLTGKECILAITYYAALVLLAWLLFASPGFLPQLLAKIWSS